MPLVDLGALLGETAAPRFTRLIVVRAGDRRVGLAVEGVHGIRQPPDDAMSALPPLLGRSDHLVESVASLDEELLLVLRAGIRVPEDVWLAMDDRRGNA